MKKNLLLLSSIILFIVSVNAQNVPNGGFESWSGGNPVSWYTDNIPTVATPITQATPSHTGAFAAKGTVVTSIAGNIDPLLQSTDMAGNGFAVTQAYSTLSFYYKTNLTGTDGFAVLIGMKDSGGNPVGFGAMIYVSSVSSFTLASVPIAYTGSNPVECSISFTIFDTTSSSTTNLGDYFIVDDVGLSGLASVQDLTTSFSISTVYPNPASQSATVHYELPSRSDVHFEIINVLGKIVQEEFLPETSAGKHDMKFDVSSLSAGIYTVRLTTGLGIASTRIQVQR